MDNLTAFTEFLLMDISSSRQLQLLQGALFLGVYLGALAGNLLTIGAIVSDPRLHAPMYFFITNLSFIDLCCISVTVPKLIVNSLAGSSAISLAECATQIFLQIVFASTELAFLVVMSYDRYVAICHPLHYGQTVTPRMCTQAAGGSWATGLVYSSIHTGNMFRLPFTKSNVIHQYFCDIPQILRISAPEVQFCEFVLLSVSAGIDVGCFTSLVLSYVRIFSAVLQMRSAEARNKALSTCTPQLLILVLFVVSGLMAVLGPIADKPSLSSLLNAVFYIMVPPFLNPVIYSLRNRDIGHALARLFSKNLKLQCPRFLD
ncbi:olfactory receptor 14I1-like [Sorex araneus]|uniref:olfactory receptor 14I1-like n=1 Tax=Sorex araneus TaxID=42254 RepID=UPI002434041F|nr:olfactory receptor 14I1-like [Sorex araneus]